MILQLADCILAIHMPTRRQKSLSSTLAAKCWMLIMDDRTQTHGWAISCEVKDATP